MVLYCSWIILLYKSINPGASAAEKILWISSIFLTSFNIENLNFVQLDWHMFLWIVYIWIVNKCIAFYLKSSSCELFCLCYILCIVVSLHVYIPLHKSHNTILSNKCKCIKNADVWRKKMKIWVLQNSAMFWTSFCTMVDLMEHSWALHPKTLLWLQFQKVLTNTLTKYLCVFGTTVFKVCIINK